MERILCENETTVKESKYTVAVKKSGFLINSEETGNKLEIPYENFHRPSLVNKDWMKDYLKELIGILYKQDAEVIIYYTNECEAKLQDLVVFNRYEFD